VAACLRFLAKGGPRGHTLEWAYRNWTAEEKISLGSLLGNKALQEQARLAQIYAGAWRELSTPNREPEWKVLMERYEAGASDVKGSIAQMLIGDAYPPVDEFMRTALTSPHVQVRRSAVHHWGFRPGAESLGHLVTALRDDQVEVLKSAIAYLQARPALESVPELIELLRAPSKEIRDQATAALVDIKKHFEAQAEWQRWYDETKKALRK
jgi:hypothetical protein